ncbi:type II toxin-antitoxin system VapC family toxin [Geoalkalibacter halelectricus]|uniref:Ribonuclease VapC n=1 Tax=Geoalkalibacter halelectricus TaxID=2847045 RepID=A0ABY5ZMM4_9BACT|nr:PIN domain-containing protein [Geoalkalibacter halelectricus]MDO3378279.1 PIN domain-containing protein [Geoalkalibacter halelectricus]UWZ79130.1 PIN domain-containing protein [Geoalkalibacter halelectricus]
METAALARVLIDTSVWIAFFRKNEPYHSLVSQWMDDDQVVCCGFILAELIQGAKSDKELAVLEDFLQVFPFIPESPELWVAAGKLSYQLRRKGVTVGLSDCLIAVAAASDNAQVATLDNHFDALCRPAGISLFPLR